MSIFPVSRRSALPASSRSASGGFTLIEVMVALVVLVLGVLGAAAMTLNSLRDSKQSALRSQASALAYELSDMMRADAPTYLKTAPYTVVVDTEPIFKGGAPSGGVSACFVGTGCPLADMATNDLYIWYQKVTGPGGLPNGVAVICRDATNPNSMSTCDQLATSPFVVKMKWDEKYNNGKFVADVLSSTDKPSLVVAIQPF